MTIPWQKVVDVLVLLYRLLVSGRTINLPGGQPVVFPDQSGELPRKLKSQLPATREALRIHAGQLTVVGRGMPDPIASTLRWFLLLTVGVPIAVLLMLGRLEWRTLTDGVPDNHITATLRRVWSQAPGQFLVGLVAWVASAVAFVVWLVTHVVG